MSVLALKNTLLYRMCVCVLHTRSSHQTVVPIYPSTSSALSVRADSSSYILPRVQALWSHNHDAAAVEIRHCTGTGSIDNSSNTFPGLDLYFCRSCTTSQTTAGEELDHISVDRQITICPRCGIDARHRHFFRPCSPLFCPKRI